MNPVLPECYRKEHVFIREIFYEPEDYSARMIYADWLEEHQDFRAELLRMDLELQQAKITDEQRESIQRRRKKLLSRVDREWVTLLAMTDIEKCPAAVQAEIDARAELDDVHVLNTWEDPPETKAPEAEITFRLRCPKRWENLIPIDENQQIRFCNECQRSVHYCYEIETARRHAQKGNCVALDPSVPRRRNDLDFLFDMDEYITLGMITGPE